MRIGTSGMLPAMKAPGETLAAFLADKPEAHHLPFLAWAEQRAKQRHDSDKGAPGKALAPGQTAGTYSTSASSGSRS